MAVFFLKRRADARDPRQVLSENARSHPAHSGGPARLPGGASSEDGDAVNEELYCQAVKLILTHRKTMVEKIHTNSVNNPPDSPPQSTQSTSSTSSIPSIHSKFAELSATRHWF